MSVSFRIFPRRGLVYVRCEGVVRVPETMAALEDYFRHPEFRPGQRQLVDLAPVTGIDVDFVDLMKLQARKAEAFYGGRSDTLVVYHVPTSLPLEMVRMVNQSWEGIDGVVVALMQTEEDALAALGQPEGSFAELMEVAR